MIFAVKSTDVLVEGVLDYGLAFLGEYLEKMLQTSVTITDHNWQIHYPENDSGGICVTKSDVMDGKEYYYNEEEKTLYYCVEIKQNKAYIIIHDLTARMVVKTVAILRENKLPVKCYFSKLNTSSERFEKELADYLFAQSNGNLRDILHLGDSDIDIDRPYFVSIIEIEEVRPAIDLSVIRAFAVGYLRRDKLKAITVCHNKQLVFIIPVNHKAEMEDKGAENRGFDGSAFKKAVEEKFELAASMGVGRVYPLIKLEKSFTEAKIAIILNHLMGRRRFTQEFSQLGIYQAIFSQNMNDTREYCYSVLGRLIEHDNKSDGDLLPTLRRLLDACGNIKATADSLFIHVNTLYYRINKIEQILETDLAKMDTRVELHTAIKVLDTLQILAGKEDTVSAHLAEASIALQA